MLHFRRSFKETKTPWVDKRTKTGTKLTKDRKVFFCIPDRLCYMFFLLLIVWFWPLWLKVICLKFHDHPKPIYNSDIGLTMTAPGLYADATADSCQTCGDQNIFYDVDVDIANYDSPKSALSASYVQLLASFDNGQPKNWYVVSTAKVLDGVSRLDQQTIELCNTNTTYEKDVRTYAFCDISAAILK